MKKVLLLILTVFLSNTVFSQLIGTNCFLQGTYAEVGICNKGVYGAGAAPAGYHPNVGTNLGFVADAGKNGWTVPGTTPTNLPNYCGDYFVPGSPEEGWCIELGGPTGTNYGFFQVNCTSPIGWTAATVPTTFSSYTATATERKVFLTIQATSGPMSALRIEKEITLPMNDLYFTTKVKITNISAATVPQVFYMRNVDPDNDQPWSPCRPGTSASGSFTTTNVIHSQPSTTSCDAHVSATGTCGCYLGYAARDPRAKVSKGNFSSRDASNVWFGSGGHITTVGSSSVADEAISLSFNLGDILPGETKTFAYAYILSASDITKAFAAIDEVVSFADGSNITSSGTTKRCAGSPVALSVSSTAGTTYSWTWTPGSTLSTTSGPSTTASPLVTTTYTARGITSCDTVYKYITVVVNDPTSFTYTSTNSTCGSSTGTITVTGITGGVGPYRYQFCSTCPIVTSNTITGLSAGTYSVTVRDTGNCAFTQIVGISAIGGISSAAVSKTHTTCGLSNGSISIGSIVGGSAPFEYNFNSTGFGSTNVFTGLSAGTYSIVVRDAFGCLLNINEVINPSTNPYSVNFITTNATCGLNNGGLSIGIVSGGIGPYSYSFNLSTFSTNNTYTGLSSGTMIPLSIIDINGCRLDTTVTILNTPSISGFNTNTTPSTCGLSNAVVSVDPTTIIGGTPIFQYSFDGSSFTTNNTAIGVTASVAYNVTIIDAYGCTFSKVISVNNIGGPTALNLTSTPASCGDNNGTVSIVGVIGGTMPYRFEYNLSGVLTTSTSVTGLSPNPTYLVRVEDANGCVFSNNISVGNILNPTTNTGVSPEVCAGSIIKLSGYVGGSATGGIWSSLGDGVFSSASSLSTTYTPGPVDISSNKVTLILTSVTPTSVPCPPSVSSLTVTINPTPNPSFVSNNNSGCVPLCVDFIDSSNVKGGSIVKWKWNFGTGTDSSVSKSPIFCYNIDGNYNVKLEVVSDKGCVGKSTINNFVRAYPIPYAEFTYDPKETTTSRSEITFMDITDSSVKWVWNFGDGVTSNIKNPTHTYRDTGIYDVKLITMNQYSCSDTVWYRVIIKPDYMFYIPTSFSPNIDGVNEYFSGKGFGIKEYKMEIFNRWGEVIYQTNDIERGWDGKYKNNDVQQDTYVYSITIRDLNNKFHPYTGTVTLVR